MKFIQKINSEDMIALNLYILKQNKRITINMMVIGFVALIGAIYSFIKEDILLGCIFLIITFFAIFGIPLLFYVIIRASIRKKMSKQHDWDILVKVDDEGIYYAFEKEDENAVEPYIWGDVSYAKSFKKYIIVQINIATYLIFKKSDCEKPEELEVIFEKNLKLGIRYFKYNK